MKIFLVGGAVRDKLLNIESQDRDWVVVGEMEKTMIEAGFSPIYANKFPIFIKNGEEYALARCEKKIGDGYHGFEVFSSPDVTLEEDLLRRDLTINAIAEHPLGHLIDPYNGMSDLNNRVLRHTSPAFTDDPVRILRLARFMAQLSDFNFTIAEETLQLTRQMIGNGELNHVTPERIWKETEKALISSKPSLYFSTLKEMGALPVIFPELDALFGVPQPEVHHPEIDTGTHILMVLDEATKLSQDPVVRFSAVMHDLGKGVTPKEILPRHHGHEEAGVPLLEALCARLKVPNDYKKLALKVTAFHTVSHQSLEIRPGRLVQLFNDLGCINKQQHGVLNDFLLACTADSKGRLGKQDSAYPQADYLQAMHKAAVSIDIKPLVERYSGQNLAFQISQQRIRSVSKAKSAFFKEINIQLIQGRPS